MVSGVGEVVCDVQRVLTAGELDVCVVDTMVFSVDESVCGVRTVVTAGVRDLCVVDTVVYNNVDE